MRFAPDPKKLLGLIILAFIITASFLYFLKFQAGKETSSLLVSSNQNKFALDFKILDKDQQNFAKILENLALPAKIQQGLEFELDATSSSKLAFATPLNLNLRLTQNSVNYQAVLEPPFNYQELNFDEIVLPKSFNLVIFAKDLKFFIKAQKFLPNELNIWLSDDLILQDGQYLVLFDSGRQYAFVSRLLRADFEKLKTIQIKDISASFYKEEVQEQVTLHLLKIPKNKTNEDLDLVLFEKDGWLYLTSSRDAAVLLIDVLNRKDQSSKLSIKSLNKERQASFLLVFSNSQDSLQFDFNKLTALNILEPSLNASALSEKLSKVKLLEFVLSQQEISGLIEMK